MVEYSCMMLRYPLRLPGHGKQLVDLSGQVDADRPRGLLIGSAARMDADRLADLPAPGSADRIGPARWMPTGWQIFPARWMP